LKPVPLSVENYSVPLVRMTHTREATVAEIERCGVVAIIRMKDPGKVAEVVDALLAGGVQVLEVTMTVPGAVQLIKDLAPRMPPELILGAGTVLDPETADRVIDAGAAFLVSPVLRLPLIETARRRGVPILPGCFSPTEILTAWDAGADLVKVFPATALGPGFLKDVHGPLPQVKLVPTGGVSIENAGDWIRAGAAAVGVGSALLDAGALASGHFSEITGNARRMIENVHLARGMH
jgi:2-dehydro-3-deoxyphosphogluconate aldolase/(4S)-4-hydroxy-2-oxoglutarate aldolase